MELVILDEDLIEMSRFSEFDSLVWNERYQEPGDFQLRSYGIENTLKVLHNGLLVGVDNSDFVMQVTNIDTDVDSLGNEVVTVTGKTLEHIFAHRPAVPKISSVFTMDADHPDGWGFGFEDEEVATLDPFQDIIYKVLTQTDTNHYGRSELKWLTLPFLYYTYATEPAGGYHGISKLQRHYVIDRGATVQDVLDELLPEAQMGIATMRPRTNNSFWDYHNRNVEEDPTRPGMCIFYSPVRLRDPVTFDYLLEDFTSESIQKEGDFTNIEFRAHEDGVTANGDWYTSMPDLDSEWHQSSGLLGDYREGGGLNRRVSLTEGLRFDLPQHELQKDHRSSAVRLFDQYAQANTYSVETSGIFPYSPKSYGLLRNSLNGFFLGDVVKLNLRGEEGEAVDVQVKEYIRTQDADGYKEYPTFTPARELGEWKNPDYSRYLNTTTQLKWN